MRIVTRGLQQRVVLRLPDGTRINIAVKAFPFGRGPRVELACDAPPEVMVLTEEEEVEDIAAGRTPARRVPPYETDIQAVVAWLAASRAIYLAIQHRAPETERLRAAKVIGERQRQLRELAGRRHIIARGFDRRMYRFVDGQVEGRWGNVDLVLDCIGDIRPVPAEGGAG